MQGIERAVFFKERKRHIKIVREIVFCALFCLLMLSASGAYAVDYVCADCHTPVQLLHGPCPDCTSCHTNKLNNISHRTGPGTPLDGDLSSAEGITAVCKTCHAGPDTLHPFIINTDPVIIIDGTTDLDYACGQCHGGSFGAGAVKNGARYITKADLASYAAGIHGDAPEATFSYTTSGLTVNFDASASYCVSGSCTFAWNWGDGNSTAASATATASHAYASAGTRTITLTVKDTERLSTDSKSVIVSVYAPDAAPVADGCGTGEISWNANTWTATCNDASTDDNGLSKVTVNFGEGPVQADTSAPFGPFSYTYVTIGAKTITHEVYDTIGQTNTETSTVTPAYFVISGTVYQSNGTTPAPVAKVVVKKGTTIVKTVYTASNGTFSATNLKPGTYTLTISKTGYTFTIPVATLTVGPTSTGNNINAVTP